MKYQVVHPDSGEVVWESDSLDEAFEYTLDRYPADSDNFYIVLRDGERVR